MERTGCVRNAMINILYELNSEYPQSLNPNKMDYVEFAEKCVVELNVLQAKFKNDFELTWYEDWYYDQATGLLTFSTDDKQLNFKFVSIGSYSEKSHTWKWSWDNTTTLDNVKEPTKLIRDFGQRSDFSKLTEGYFPSEEVEAWEFVAIAAKILNGIGVYRPVNDTGLKIFLVITEFVDNETAQTIKDRYIECQAHEKQRSAFVCNHLIGANKVGFNEAFDTVEDMELGEDDGFQAWCDQCEAKRQKEGEWNDNSQALVEIKLVCEKCYFEMKEINLGHR